MKKIFIVFLIFFLHCGQSQIGFQDASQDASVDFRGGDYINTDIFISDDLITTDSILDASDVYLFDSVLSDAKITDISDTIDTKDTAPDLYQEEDIPPPPPPACDNPEKTINESIKGGVSFSAYTQQGDCYVYEYGYRIFNNTASRNISQWAAVVYLKTSNSETRWFDYWTLIDRSGLPVGGDISGRVYRDYCLPDIRNYPVYIIIYHVKFSNGQDCTIDLGLW